MPLRTVYLNQHKISYLHNRACAARPIIINQLFRSYKTAVIHDITRNSVENENKTAKIKKKKI